MKYKRKYAIGKTYNDKGSITNQKDEFLRWINEKGVSGIQNTSGIRRLNFDKNLKKSIPAFIFLITNRAKGGSGHHKPWEDVIDVPSGKIYYWGDSKYHPKKICEDFYGNRLMKMVYNLVLERKYDQIPPILHFTKKERGKVTFNGLCIIDDMEYSWIEDKGNPVRNYRFILKVLDTEYVLLEWIKNKFLKNDNSRAPKSWKRFVKTGKVNYIKYESEKIPKKEDQIPNKGSDDYKILKSVCELNPFEFERLTVELLRNIKNIEHIITQTKKTGDGGFDFFGHFKLPHPLNYTIRIKGEAKRFSLNTGVQPKQVSRLVARLDRGEYGIFITTSYFTKQAREEIINDRYPVKLISGSDLVNFLREFNFVTNNTLNKKLIESEK